jgi:prepilin-type processing-associated H-X9-DG protein
MGLAPFGAGQTPSNYAGTMNADYFFFDTVNQNQGMMPYWSDLNTYPPNTTAWQPFAPTRKTKDVADGLSHTTYALEIRAKVYNINAGQANEVVDGVTYGTCYTTWFNNMPVYYIAYQDYDYFNSASPWFIGAITIPKFGINVPLRRGAALSQWPPFITSGSYHPGGAHALMADGSVQFISESVDLNALKAMTTISKGEALPQGF